MGFRGSLTPQMHVAVVRQKRALTVTLRAPPVSWGRTRIDFIDDDTPVRFSPETAFIWLNALSH